MDEELFKNLLKFLAQDCNIFLIIKEILKNNLLEWIYDQYGNHVVQKLIEKVPYEDISFIQKQIEGNWKQLWILNKFFEWNCRRPRLCQIHRGLDIGALVKGGGGLNSIEYGNRVLPSELNWSNLWSNNQQLCNWTLQRSIRKLRCTTYPRKR